MTEPNLISSLPRTIDPLAPGPRGRYDDHLVSVVRAEPPSGRAAAVAPAPVAPVAPVAPAGSPPAPPPAPPPSIPSTSA